MNSIFERINAQNFASIPSHKKDADAFFDFISKEMKHTVPSYQPIRDLEVDKRFDSNAQIGFFLAKNLLRGFVCEAHLTHKNFKNSLLDFLKEKGNLLYRKVMEDEIVYIFLYKDLILNLMVSDMLLQDKICGISIFHTIDTDPFPKELEDFIIPNKEVSEIGLIKATQYGPTVSWIDFTSDQEFSLDHYNDDFEVFLDDLTKKLNTSKTGLYLLHGESGTGKSSSIRHIISKVKRQFVFIAPQMVHCLTTPEFTNLITSQLKGSVLIIEDAEKALMKRTSEDAFHNSELVSCLLNLTDGLYADMAGTSIIATYNCERSLIDPALLRKGRLKSEYHFKKLSIDKSQKVMDKQGHDVTVNDGMTLADIFNYESQYTNNKPEKRTVGFGR